MVFTPFNYTSRDPKQLRADGRAQTCQQLVAFCASTQMNQNDAVVNLARVALLHVCCWRASRFSTAPELRLGKRAPWRASARARVNASVAAQARSHMGSSNTHVQFRHTCVYTWNTHTCTTETEYIHLRHTHKCVELENKHVLLGKHTHTCANVEGWGITLVAVFGSLWSQLKSTHFGRSWSICGSLWSQFLDHFRRSGR